jgi:hypothetical protein
MTSTNGTFGALLDNGFTVYVYCVSSSHCHHSTTLYLEEMAAKYGRDHGSLHDDLIKLPWTCVNCGGRKVSFRYQPGAMQYGYRPPRESAEDFRKAKK